MSTAIAQMTVEEFLKDTSKPYLEYLDGVVERKSTSTIPRGLLQYALLLLLRQRGWKALAEIRVAISPTRYRVPDVIVDRILKDRYPSTPVHLCVEILSPDDTPRSAMESCEDYHRWGVSYCWIFDPESAAAWEYHAGLELREVPRDGVLRAGEIELPVGNLLAEVERQR